MLIEQVDIFFRKKCISLSPSVLCAVFIMPIAEQSTCITLLKYLIFYIKLIGNNNNLALIFDN
jgi:hypothetical protein